MKFDIVILSKKSDFNKLKFLINSIEDNISGYDDIYIISPEKIDIDGIINYTDFEVIDEVYKKTLSYRPGWIFQQYIKLLQDVTKNDYYLVIDSDVYINNKIDIFTDGKPNFFLGRDQYHEQYFRYLNYFNINKNLNHSFISEIMLFDKRLINNFLKMKNMDRNSFLSTSNGIINNSCYISEFEFYGNMVLQYYKDQYSFKEIKTELNGKHGEWSDVEIENLINSNKNLDIISYHTWG
jgi:hypothetical protein